MKKKETKTVYEYQWLEPTKKRGTKTVYESTFDFFTESEAKKKGLFHCIPETKRLRVKNPPLLSDIDNLIRICQVNIQQIEEDKETKKEINKDDKLFDDLVTPYLKKMLVKYKMKYTNRRYAIYPNKRQESKVLPPNDVLNKDNKKVSLWWQITNKSFYYLKKSEISERLQEFIEALEGFKKLFFTTTQEQRDRILALDPKAKFPENEMVQTTLDYYDLEAALLNKKNKLRGPWYYPELDADKPKEKVIIKPEELSFLRAHGHSMCMIRYKGLYYGYYTSNYVRDHKDKDTDESIHHDMGITREQTVKEIERKQVIGQPFVKDCFSGMNNSQIQKFCLDRLEKLDNTNYTNNDDYSFTEAFKFCHEHGLDEAAKYIIKNFPDREEVKKYLGDQYFCFWTPIYEYIGDGNLDMIKFLYEQGAYFPENSHRLVKHAAKINQLEIFKFLYSKYKYSLKDRWKEESLYIKDVGENFVDEVAENGHVEVLEFLAKQGYFASAIERTKKDNTSYYNKEMANMFVRHKAMYLKLKKAEKIKEEKAEKIRKQKEAEIEKKRKEKLIKNIDCSSVEFKNKIKNLSSEKFEKLEEILSK